MPWHDRAMSFKLHSTSFYAPIAAMTRPWTCAADRDIILLKAYNIIFECRYSCKWLASENMKSIPVLPHFIQPL